jgi:glutathione synthase/RimK-type ligase-like ATP-grasp enzyme
MEAIKKVSEVLGEPDKIIVQEFITTAYWLDGEIGIALIVMNTNPKEVIN